MSLTSSLLSRVLGGGSCSREELIALSREPLEELCQAANAIREHFCGNVFDLCTIINGRSGKCSENCKYCAQSAHYSKPFTLEEMQEMLHNLYTCDNKAV